MHRRLLGIVLAAGLAVLAGCSDGGVIQGKVVVGPGQDGLEVFALLLEQQLQTGPDGTPQLKWTAIAQQAVGTASGDGGSFAYSFYGLEKGTYAIGAYADLHDDRDITDDASTFDLNSPLKLDPASDATAQFTHDVYVAKSAPDKGTLRGTLHASARAAGLPIEILVLDKPLTDPSANVVSFINLPAGGTDVPFGLFNVPASTEVQVFARAMKPDNTVAFWAFHPFGAVTVDAAAEKTGVDLWMDRQSPDLGGIAGKVVLNAPISPLSLEFVVFDTDPSKNDGALVEAILDADGAGKVEIPFSIPSLRLGKKPAREGDAPLPAAFVQVIEQTRDGDGTQPSTSRIFPVYFDADTKIRDGLEFKLGVGRVSGTITITGADAVVPPKGRLDFVLVGAMLPVTSPGATTMDFDTYRFFPVTTQNGAATLSYSLFGLLDDTYQIVLVPNLNGPGPEVKNLPEAEQKNYDDDVNPEISCNFDAQSCHLAFPGNPDQVTIRGGGREHSDITVKLSR